MKGQVAAAFAVRDILNGHGLGGSEFILQSCESTKTNTGLNLSLALISSRGEEVKATAVLTGREGAYVVASVRLTSLPQGPVFVLALPRGKEMIAPPKAAVLEAQLGSIAGEVGFYPADSVIAWVSEHIGKKWVMVKGPARDLSEEEYFSLVSQHASAILSADQMLKVTGHLVRLQAPRRAEALALYSQILAHARNLRKDVKSKIVNFPGQRVNHLEAEIKRRLFFSMIEGIYYVHEDGPRIVRAITKQGTSWHEEEQASLLELWDSGTLQDWARNWGIGFGTV